MKTIGIITARAGSKGLLCKNKKVFSGKPLIEWTCEAALKAKMLDSVVVSTDDWEIAEIGKRCGCGVPFIRPAELAQDGTPHIDVVLHALREVGCDTFTHCCLLQPTSPLRTAQDIDEACILAAKHLKASVLSVTEDRDWPFVVGKALWGGLKAPPPGYRARQGIAPRYFINGAVYVNPIPMLFEEKSFYHGRLLPYVMPKARSLQIDDQFDFDCAEYVMWTALDKECP